MFANTFFIFFTALFSEPQDTFSQPVLPPPDTISTIVLFGSSFTI